MAAEDHEPTPPGWYRQHDDPDTLRWWDGTDWTDDTMTAPSDGAPAPAPAGPSAEPSAGSGTPPPGTGGPEAPRRAPTAPGRAAPTRKAPTAPGRAAPTGKAPARRAAPSGKAPARRAAPSSKGPARRSGGSGPAPRGSRAGAGAPRPAQRMGAGGGAHRSGGRATAGPGGRTVASERVVRRRPQGPGPGLRVGLRALLIAAVVGVLYLGYVQVRDAEAPDARTVTDEPADTPEQRFRPVADAALTLADLPGGWAAQAHDPGVDDICHGRIPRTVIPPEDVGSAAFTQGPSGPFLTTILARFEDQDTARAFLDLTERVVESCRAYEANGATVRLGPLDYPRFGDDTFVAQATGDSQFGALTGRIVYVRVGTLVASVESIAFGDAEVSDQLVEHLANLLAKRLRALEEPS